MTEVTDYWKQIRRVRAAAFVAAAFLLAGSVVNVAVAWACAAWSPYKDVWHLNRRYWPGSGPIYRSGKREVGVGIERSLVTYSNADVILTYLFRTSTGWPCLALTGEVGGYDKGSGIVLKNKWFGGPVNRGGFPMTALGAAVLPLLPVWPGFTVNTLFYAAILWLLTCGPFALRRFIRRRRGLCPACAYPVGESDVCTECGKPLPLSIK